MSELHANHPDSQDLLNLARERLGAKKSQRILDHCKECPACAEALLDAVREHAPRGERLPISRWQWASIVLFVVALAAVVAVMMWFVRSAAAPMLPNPDLEAPAGESSPMPTSESPR